MNTLYDFDYDYMKFKYGKEDLHDVFATMLDTYKNISSPKVVDQVNLWELLQNIKYNFINVSDTSIMFTPKYINGVQNDAYGKIKAGFPSVCFNAKFYGYKDSSHLKSITNLMFLDIDNFKTKAEALAYRAEIISKYDWIVACNLSLSNIGLHIIITVDKIIDAKDYNDKYDFISHEYFDGILDKSSKSLTRHTIVPYDYNIYINENPKTLEIDYYYRNNEEGIRSVDSYERKANKEKGIRSVESKVSSGSNKKGIRSVEDEVSLVGKEEGICSAYKGGIISTAYTFLNNSPAMDLMNTASLGLRFKQELKESVYNDHNIPMYFHEGIDVIENNPISRFKNGVPNGQRTSFIGALTVQMIYLNVEYPDHPDPKVRENILGYILGINEKLCKPPLPEKEVLNSYNSNWRRYKAGELDFSIYFKKQRAFWSKYSTLKGNDKRIVTCHIKNEPTIAESKRKIKSSIETIISTGMKLTQKEVAKVSGLSLPTIKKYRIYYKELTAGYKLNVMTSHVPPIENEAEIIPSNDIPAKQVSDPPSSIPNIIVNEPHSIMDIEKIEEIIIHTDNASMECTEALVWTEEQMHVAFNRIFIRIINKLDENEVQELSTIFAKQINELSIVDATLLMTPDDNLVDSEMFFKQSSLDMKLLGSCLSIIHEKVEQNV